MSTNIQEHIIASLREALQGVAKSVAGEIDLEQPIQLERARQSAHGDFSTNLALKLAKVLGTNPRELAQEICKQLPQSQRIHKTEVAGAGFINFFVAQDDLYSVVQTVLTQAERYGCSEQKGERIQLEFVSANPTGSLHVGHGRSAAYGSCLARILRAGGHEVECEYYINDAGRQMNILALSVWWRYCQACGEKAEIPPRCYLGDYIDSYGRELHKEHGERWRQPISEWDIDAETKADDELYLDTLIERMREALGECEFDQIRDLSTQHILGQIKEELALFGVDYEHWFSESDLLPKRTEQAIQRLIDGKHTEERDGSIWFLSTRFGDDRDRVLRRQNGVPTYFATDIAYHLDKFERGYDRIINVWGADHHGYIGRVRAALEALGLAVAKLEIQLVQLVNLRRGEEIIPMSTRAGQFINLSTLCEEVGVDAARFFYVMRRIDQKSDFDLMLAKETSKDNPVYYIQYAHARLCSIEQKMAEADMVWDKEEGIASLTTLVEEEELRLLRRLDSYPELLERAGNERAPHLLATFLRELAGEFHLCYNNHRVLVEDSALRNARIALFVSVKQVLVNGLAILGLSAPEKM